MFDWAMHGLTRCNILLLVTITGYILCHLFLHYITVHWNSLTFSFSSISLRNPLHPLPKPIIPHHLHPYSLIAIKARCVCQTLFQRVIHNMIQQQGAGVCLRCLQPTKTHLLHSDMTKGRLCHVPALVIKLAYSCTSDWGCLGLTGGSCCVSKILVTDPALFSYLACLISADCIHIEASFYHTSVCVFNSLFVEDSSRWIQLAAASC